MRGVSCSLLIWILVVVVWPRILSPLAFTQPTIVVLVWADFDAGTSYGGCPDASGCSQRTPSDRHLHLSRHMT